MRIIALWFGKFICWALKLAGRQGSALPGLIILKFYPAFLAKSLALLPEGVVVITGTNGKTTSTKMLAHVIGANYRVLTNPTGSNFIRGIISAILHHSKLNGRLPYDIAVLELDEAYAARFVELYNPRATLVTNIMRDQMDRFGEIDTTAKLIQKVVKHTTELVVLNRDDPRVAELANHTSHTVYYFGVATKLRQLYVNDDELHETAVGDQSSTPAMAELLDIKKDGRVQILLGDVTATLKLAADSTFNYQNATAVCAIASALGVENQDIFARLEQVKPAFGRGEKIIYGNKEITLQLVKNPGGFRHALHSIDIVKPTTIMFVINDDYADGRDVSWLWDVEFSSHMGKYTKAKKFTSGTRAADMALRLKYDGVRTDTIDPSLDNCLQLTLQGTKKDGRLLIFTTYTAMLYLRKAISKITEVDAI